MSEHKERRPNLLNMYKRREVQVQKAVVDELFFKPACTTNLDALFYPNLFRELIDKSAQLLTEFAKLHPFNALAGTGTSGLPIVGALSYKLGIPMIAVRKPDEKSHNFHYAQGNVYGSRYVIVDDLIESGSTIDNTIKNVIRAHNDVDLYGQGGVEGAVKATLPVCVGILLYHQAGIDYEGIPIIDAS